MIQSDAAKRQIHALRAHFRKQGRFAASANLTQAIRQAARQIAAGSSLPAPRPYPDPARPGEAWTHVHRYWVAQTTGPNPTIIACSTTSPIFPADFDARLPP